MFQAIQKTMNIQDLLFIIYVLQALASINGALMVHVFYNI